MTYCIGWRYGESVYLVADSLVTKETPSVSPISSFGEVHVGSEGWFVEESLLKLMRVADDCAIAYSGSVDVSISIVEFISTHYCDAMNIEMLLQSASNSLGPFSEFDSSSLLIALSGEKGPRLIEWNTSAGIVQSDAEFAEIGSLCSPVIQIPRMLLSFFRERDLPEEHSLAAITAMVQSFGIHYDHLSQGVGGVFCGLSVSASGVKWQRDTRFILYDDEMSNVSRVSVIVRDDSLALHSSRTNEASVFMTSVPNRGWQEWLHVWEKKVCQQLNSIDFDYWVFVSLQRMLITIVYWRPEFGDCAYFKIRSPRPGVTELLPSKAFVMALTRDFPQEPQLGGPWLLQFLDGRADMLAN
jgi:hypothetical protein